MEPEAPRSAPPSSPLWRRLLPWLLTAACLAAVAKILVGSREEIALSLARLESRTLVAGLALSAVNILLFSLRTWQVMARCSGVAIPYLFWQRFFVLSQFLNSALPQAGSIYRAVRLKREIGLGYTAYVGGYFVFAWLSVLFLLLCATLILGSSGFSPRPFGVPLALWPAAAALLLFLAPALAVMLCRLGLPSWRPVAWLAERLSAVFAMGPACLQSPSFAALFLLLALLGLLPGLLVLSLLCQGIGLSPSPGELLVIFVLIQLSGYVAVTPGNIGVQELLYALVGSQVGFTLASGVMLSLLIRVLHLAALALLTLGLVGLPALIRIKGRTHLEKPE